jgi:hypothetical protein
MIVPHHHPAGVARQALRRFRGNARAVLEDGLARLIRVRQYRGVDVNHHLVPLSRRAGIEPVVEGRLREQGQRVRLLLGHGRGVVTSRLVTALLLVQRLARCGQRPQEQGSHFRRQPPPDNQHAVLFLVDVKRAARVLGRVYEYFLSQFASAEGKKGGEFYTPRCVVKLLVEMLEPYQGRVYDPCCGSSGMFVQSVEFIRAHAKGNGNGGKAKAEPA